MVKHNFKNNCFNNHLNFKKQIKKINQTYIKYLNSNNKFKITLINNKSKNNNYKNKNSLCKI